MQALILAAGSGKRLDPLTEDLPKALVEVNGTPLLVNILNNLKSTGITLVIIVVGHMKEKIIQRIGYEFNGLHIAYVVNDAYETTNNIYSLWLARDIINDDVLLLECDLFFNGDLLETVMKDESECTILTSDYNSETMNGTVITIDPDNNADSMILKIDQRPGLDLSKCKKTANIYRMNKQFIKNKFMPAIDLYVRTQDVSSFYEIVLGALIYFKSSVIKAVNVPENMWFEIDDLEDLRRAEKHLA